MDNVITLPLKGRFNPERARLMAVKAVAARKAKAEQRRLEALAPSQSAGSDPVATDEYLTDRVTSARKEIERLIGLAGKETDPLNCERLARAIGQWSEIERIACGRPLPGSRKPASEKARKVESIIPL